MALVKKLFAAGLGVVLGGVSSYASIRKDRYLVARVEGSSYHTPILSSEMPNPFSMHLHGYLDATMSQGEARRFSKLCEVYATELCTSAVRPEEVDRMVEERLRQCYEHGDTQQVLQARLGVDTMQEVRWKLRKRFTKTLALQRFVCQITPLDMPSPSQVARFYQRHFARFAPAIPAKVVLLQLALYPAEDDTSMQGPIAYLTHIYDELMRIEDVEERHEAFLDTIAEALEGAPYPSVHGYLLDKYRQPQLSMDEVPQAIKQAFLSTGATVVAPHMITPPHRFTDPHGHEGVRVVLVQACISPHTLSLEEDYAYLARLCAHASQASALKAWWEVYAQETERYG